MTGWAERTFVCGSREGKRLEGFKRETWKKEVKVESVSS